MMKLWKRNAVVAAIVLFVCAAVYLNWSYQNENKDTADVGKTLGQASLVGAPADPLLDGASAPASTPSVPETSSDPAASPSPEATPAPAAQSSGYFAAARLNRQQARDSALSLLQQASEGDSASEAMREEAVATIQTLADFTVSEAQIENLITAKGYADCVAFIGDSSVSVVVSTVSGGLTDADIAKITEIVTGETGLKASQITIIEAE